MNWIKMSLLAFSTIIEMSVRTYKLNMYSSIRSDHQDILSFVKSIWKSPNFPTYISYKLKTMISEKFTFHVQS